jgi:hypothetical protein
LFFYPGKSAQYICGDDRLVPVKSSPKGKIMRRTALFLGGVLLATGASLALAGPAQASEVGNHNDRGGYANSVADLRNGDHPDVVIINNGERYYPGRYYGGYNSNYWLGLGFNFHGGIGNTYYPGYGYGSWGFGAGFGVGFGGGFGGGF